MEGCDGRVAVKLGTIGSRVVRTRRDVVCHLLDVFQSSFLFVDGAGACGAMSVRRVVRSDCAGLLLRGYDLNLRVRWIEAWLALLKLKQRLVKLFEISTRG